MYNYFMFGGDYCPEQWDPSVWEEDMRLMKELHVNTVTINVHSWIIMQPERQRFDMQFLDTIIGLAKKNDMKIVLGTGTTAMPNWLYMEDNRAIRTDRQGRPHKIGVRENFCPSNISYQYAIDRVCDQLASYYKDEEAIVLWHLSNELFGFCFCDTCGVEFRKWLKKEFGTLEALNDAWCTVMWGRKYTDWDQIEPPTELNEVYLNVNNEGFNLDSLPCETIAYYRFMTDQHVELFRIEGDAIRKHIPNAVVTNNHQFRTFNYHRLNDVLDVVSYDTYPQKHDEPHVADFTYDISRNLKIQGQPFLVMEMTPNHASWDKVAGTKRPGQIGLIAMNAIGRGANSSLYFQIRQSPAGFEKFHGAMIGHVGHVDTRVGRELKALGADLQKLPDDLLAAKIEPEVGIIFDWDNKLGVEIACGFQKNMDYHEEVRHYYRYFNENNIPTDLISCDQDFSRYRMIVAPMLYMLTEETGEKLQKFVEAGGVLFLTYYSGYTDLSDYIHLGGYPGPLRKVAGVWIEETDALQDFEKNVIVFDDGSEYECGFMCDVLHLEGAEAKATYKTDYYQGFPVLTENTFGDGLCVYLAAKPSREGVDAIFSNYCERFDIEKLLEPQEGIRVSLRKSENAEYLFISNHAAEEKTIRLPEEMQDLLSKKKASEYVIPARGYLILTK